MKGSEANRMDKFAKLITEGPRAVCYKLNIEEAAFELKNLKRLERVLVFQRLLYKKVTIMPKDIFSKLEDAICNIPVETNDIVNVFPRGADNNELIFVKFK